MMQAPPHSQGDIVMGNTHHFAPIAAPPTPSPAPVSYAPHFAPRPSASPAPVPVPQYGAHPMHGTHATPPMPPQTPHFQPQQHQPPPPQGYNGYPPQHNGPPTPMAHHAPPPQHPQHPMNNHHVVGYDPSQQQRLAPSPARPPVAPMPAPSAPAPASAYNPPPRPIEVYRLDDVVNERIPADIRAQFQRDADGRILFFTQPPLDRAHRGLATESAALGHSMRYLADRAEGIESRRAKRKARDELRKEEDRKKLEMERARKQQATEAQVDMAVDVFSRWIGTINQETETLKQQYDGWSVRDEDINAVRPKAS